MSEKKKVKYSDVVIAGEVLNVSKMEVKWEGTASEREIFTLTVEVAPNENIKLIFDNSVYGFDGQPSKKAEGARTIYNEIVTKSETGKGDMVRCLCKIDNQQYYSNGELKEFQNIKVDYCHRQKAGETITPSQMWAIDTLIKSIEEKEGYLEIKGLTNDYLSTNSGKVRGMNLTYRVVDPEIIEGFKELYQVGCIAKLTGEFREKVTVVDSGKRTFGKVASTKPSIERWLEVVGGEEAYNVEYDENYAIKGFFDITDNTHPFSKENIEKMESQIAESLQKSKDKDAQKMANTQQLSDENIPF